jgi:hypothetical protein
MAAPAPTPGSGSPSPGVVATLCRTTDEPPSLSADLFADPVRPACDQGTFRDGGLPLVLTSRPRAGVVPVWAACTDPIGSDEGLPLCVPPCGCGARGRGVGGPSLLLLGVGEFSPPLPMSKYCVFTLAVAWSSWYATLPDDVSDIELSSPTFGAAGSTSDELRGGVVLTTLARPSLPNSANEGLNLRCLPLCTPTRGVGVMACGVVAC